MKEGFLQGYMTGVSTVFFLINAGTVWYIWLQMAERRRALAIQREMADYCRNAPAVPAPDQDQDQDPAPEEVE